MKVLTKDNFKTEVENYGKIIVVFSAAWDTFANKTINFLNGIKDPSFKWMFCDFDEERELSEKYSIRQLPSVLVLKNGRVQATVNKCENQETLNKILGNENE